MKGFATGITANTASVTLAPALQVLDFEPAVADVRAEVIAGLSKARKTLPCKLFYDEAGSDLFDQICELPEYYPTRTELRIMREFGDEMAECIGTQALIVEYGSGTSLKTRVLLDHLEEPVDALAFLRSIRGTCGAESGLLIGVDRKKDPSILHAAYNDAAGVTARFNLNVLCRINRDINSSFDAAAFAHYAPYNPSAGRMEMNLVSRREQIVDLSGGRHVRIAEGEAIQTESCYKFTIESFARLAAEAGYRRKMAWTDSNDWFSVIYFEGCV